MRYNYFIPIPLDCICVFDAACRYRAINCKKSFNQLKSNYVQRNFTCTNGRPNKSGLNKITVWINVNGERATATLDLRVNKSEFKKAIGSAHSNYINRYCSDVRCKIDEYYTVLLGKGLRVRADDLAEYVRNGYQAKNYMLYQL